MKIMAQEREMPEVKAADFRPHLQKEAARVWELYQDGTIREIYFDKNHNAVLILECTDEEEAGAILGTLPLVREKLIAFEITPLYPYDGFSRLFDNLALLQKTECANSNFKVHGVDKSKQWLFLNEGND